MKAGRYRKNRNSRFDFKLMKNFQNKTKIVKVSKIVRAILFVGCFGWTIEILISLVNCFFHNSLWRQYAHDGMLCSPTAFRLGGDSLIYIFAIVINVKLFRFFSRLKNGCLFDAQTVGNLDAAGKWWLVLWLFQGLFLQIGNEYFGTRNSWNAAGMFAGLTLIFVAWLLKEAQELQEEQELTV